MKVFVLLAMLFTYASGLSKCNTCELVIDDVKKLLVTYETDIIQYATHECIMLPLPKEQLICNYITADIPSFIAIIENYTPIEICTVMQICPDENNIQ